MQRPDGRTKGAMRPVKITTDYTMYAEGSVLVEMGNTKVICTASVEEKVPPFLEGKGLGWVTAEYAMLPRATNTRKKRDIKSLKLDGRSSEIQRLIGRALRAVVTAKHSVSARSRLTAMLFRRTAARAARPSPADLLHCGLHAKSCWPMA